MLIVKKQLYLTLEISSCNNTKQNFIIGEGVVPCTLCTVKACLSIILEKRELSDQQIFLISGLLCQFTVLLPISILTGHQ